MIESEREFPPRTGPTNFHDIDPAAPAPGAGYDSLEPIRVRRSESLQGGLRRIMLELVASAANYLGDENVPRDRAIHEARKAMKRARAALRMIRFELGNDTYQFENIALRDIARSLSEARDAAVLVEVFDALLERFQGSVPPLIDLRADLIEYSDQQTSALDQSTVDRAIANLIGVHGRVAEWPVVGQSSLGSDLEYEFALVEAGIGQVYRRGERAMGAAYRTGTTEGFHEWRKRVKYLRYQAEFLEGAWPPVVGGVGSSLKLLAESLGEEHDLAVVNDTVAALELGSSEERRLLHVLVDGRRRELQRQLAPLGRTVYAEPAEQFTRRIRTYWKAWRAEELS